MYTIKAIETLPQKKANGWKNKNRKPMANQKDLQDLYNTLTRVNYYGNGKPGDKKTNMQIRFEHVKAHQDH